MQPISVFLDIAIFADFRLKMQISVELKGCVTCFMCFLDLIKLRYKWAKFHHFRVCVTDFREGEPFCPSPLPLIWEQRRKGTSWIGLNPRLKVFVLTFWALICNYSLLQKLILYQMLLDCLDLQTIVGSRF